MTPPQILTVPPELANITLGAGGHAVDGDCLCFMEAVSKRAGEPLTAHPKTACHTITYMAIGISDSIEDDVRQQLKPLVDYVVGTRGDGHDDDRLAYAMRWAITQLVPELLGRIGEYSWEDRFAEYDARLPQQLDDPRWGAPLGELQTARMEVRLRSTLEGILDERKREAYRDVDAMLGRIIAALTDLVDPERVPGEHQAIAATLSQFLQVHLEWDWTPFQHLLVAFLKVLIFTGRESYL